MRGWLGRRPVRVDERYSATLVYRYARRCGADRRMAYLLAVAKHGWPYQSKLAAGTCRGWSLTARLLAHP